MSDPERVSRHWLALAVAMLWTVSVGGEAEAAEEAAGSVGPATSDEESWLKDLSPPASAPPAPGAGEPVAGEPGTRPEGSAASPWERTVSVFARGWALLSQALSAGRLLRVRWYPEPLAGLDLAHAGFS